MGNLLAYVHLDLIEDEGLDFAKNKLQSLAHPLVHVIVDISQMVVLLLLNLLLLVFLDLFVNGPLLGGELVPLLLGLLFLNRNSI